MALFNKSLKKTKQTTNRAGGAAYKQTPEVALASMLLTSFAQDQYYRKANTTFAELVKLLTEVDAEFAAKAGIYARTKYGMRSISHVLAAELSAYASGEKWAKSFYEKIIYRPDDMLEILSYYMNKGGKTVPNAMKKGFAQAFGKFDAYQLAKYRGENRAVKLVDAVNLVHPKPTAKNAEALRKLMAGELKSTTTWEAKLTKAGQTAENAKDKAKKKEAAWKELIESRKLGYFALLRNLRNIADQSPKTLNAALKMLKDERLIKKSLVLPFRYLTAYKQFDGTDAKSRKIRAALDVAIEISCNNVPALKNTLVAIDNSGSMQSRVANSKHLMCSEAGAIFGMVLAKKCNADIMEFGTTARYIKYNLNDSVTHFGATFADKNKVGHGTNFHAIFEKANRKYDRIVIFSDMQAWIGGTSPAAESLKTYKNRTGANPYVYAFDLLGYGTSQFTTGQVFQLAGFSDKVFDIMSMLETDRNALVNEIKKVEL